MRSVGGDSDARARMEAAMKALEEAKAKAVAESQARVEAERRARQESEARQREEEDFRAREERDRQEREVADRRTKEQLKELQEQAQRARAEALTRSDAERRGREEAEVRLETERRAREEAEAQAEAERKGREEALAKAKTEAEARARAEVQDMIEQERQAREAAEARVETERKAREEAERRAQSEIAAKAAAERKAQEEALQQAEIARKAREEADRRAREADESNASRQQQMEAEAIARKAEQAMAQARTIAEAAGRAKAEAEAKAEMERRARADAEDRAKAEAVSRVMHERELREKAQEEVSARVAAELKAREVAEMEADARYRQEAAARAKDSAAARRRREEEERETAASAVRAPGAKVNWPKVAGIGFAVLVVAFVAVVHILPLSVYVPAAERAISERLRTPVKVGDVRYAFIPSPRLTLERIAIGRHEEIKVSTIEVNALPTELIGGPTTFDEVEITGVSADQKVLGLLPAWLKPADKGQAFGARRLKFRAVKIAFRGVDIPGFNADVLLEEDGALKRMALFDGRLTVNVVPKGQTFEAEVQAGSWEPPIGPAIPFDDLAASMVIDGRQARIGKIEARLGRGTLRGSATASWDRAIVLEGDFNLANGETSEVLAVFTNAFTATGALNMNGTYALRSDTVQGLFANPRVQATFTVEKGSLNNVDIVRAVQSPVTDGIRGGRTLFNDLSGTLQVYGDRFLYQHVRLGSGPLRADGEVTVGPGGNLSGRIRADVGSGSIIVGRGNLAVRGSLRTPVLLP